jgi:hypothetical protein
MTDQAEWQEFERFQAQGTEGAIHEVVGYRRLVANTPAGRFTPIDRGPLVYRLAGSEKPLIKCDTETFKIAQTNEIIRKIK